MLPDPAPALADPTRLSALRAVGLLDAPAEAAFERLAQLAVKVLDVPIALVTLVTPERQFFASAVGLPEPWASRRETPLTHSICQHVVAAGAPLAVADLRLDPDLRANLAIRDLGIVAYAGVPLSTTDGQAIGTFALLDTRPHAWTPDELAVLEDLAALTMTRIEVRAERAGRERAESALREAERRFRGLVDQSLTGIYVIQDRRFSYVNAKFAEIFGYTVDEVLALPSLAPLVAPEDRARLVERITRRINGESVEGVTAFRGIHRSGRRIELEAHGGTAEFDGRPAAVGVLIDVTERVETLRRAEAVAAELQTVLDAMSEVILVLDAEGRYQRIIPGGKHQLAFAPERFLGRTVHETMPPELAERTMELVRETLRTGRTRQAEYAMPGAAGEMVWYDATVSPMPGDRVFWVARDVSGRKRAEEALRHSEARYRTLVAASAQIVWSSGPNGETGHSDSAAWSAFTGQSPAEGRTGWAAVVHPEDRARIEETWRRALAAKEPYETECRLRRHDGEWRYVQVRGVPLRDADGRVTEWIGTITDVTERRQAEEAIRESEAEWRALLGALDEVILVLDRDGRYLKIAPSATNKLYRPPEELLGRTMHEVLPAEQAGEFLRHVRRALDARRLEEFEYPLTIEGREYWFRASISPLDAERVVCMARDVSEQRRAEAALRASERRLSLALEGSNDGLWDWDLATATVYYSPRWWRMLGYEPGELPATAESWRMLVHPDDLPGARARLYAHVEGRTPAYEAEYRIRHRDGRWIWILDRGKAVERDATGRALRVVGTHTDLTERRQLEEQLRQAQKMEAVGQLAGGVAHDFNNLLAAIKINCSLLEGTVGTGHGAEEVEEIRRAADRAALLTRQLLAFGRRQVMQPQVVNLNEVITESELLLERLPGAGITLEYALEPGLPPVWADRGQLAQVLLNLVLNARDAMPEGGAIVIATASETLAGETPARPGLPGGRWVRLTVADSGIGMDAETQARIFEPFFTTKAPGRGTGLGLSVVYGIVEQSGGRIYAESAPGSGTTMSVYLPAYEGGADAGAAAAAATLEEHGGRETVLLVEDEAAVRKSLRRLLQHHGYTVIEARHGADALRLFDAAPEQVDLVVTDLAMPELGGWPLVEELRRRRPSLPVVVVSGYDAEALTHELPARSVFVGKPFTSSTLLRAVRGLLDEAEN